MLYEYVLFSMYATLSCTAMTSPSQEREDQSEKVMEEGLKRGPILERLKRALTYRTRTPTVLQAADGFVD